MRHLLFGYIRFYEFYLYIMPLPMDYYCSPLRWFLVSNNSTLLFGSQQPFTVAPSLFSRSIQIILSAMGLFAHCMRCSRISKISIKVKMAIESSLSAKKNANEHSGRRMWGYSCHHIRTYTHTLSLSLYWHSRNMCSLNAQSYSQECELVLFASSKYNHIKCVLIGTRDL